MSSEPMTPEKAFERVISLLQSCKGSNGCLGYIERYFYEEDEQAIDIAIQLLKEGEVYMSAEDFNLYMEGYKQGRKDFERPQGEWVRKEDIMQYIATQYSEHNELVPIWLNIGDLKGEWVGDTDLDNTCRCSKCRMTFDTDRLKMVMCDGKYELPPCCPNCGADMRGKE